MKGKFIKRYLGLILTAGLLLNNCTNAYASEVQYTVQEESDTDNGISPLWNSHDDPVNHIKDQHQRLASNAGHKNNLQEEYVQLMVQMAAYPDFHRDVIPNVHGHGNYLAILKGLWKYSKLIGESNVETKILNSMPNLKDSGKQELKDMLKGVTKILETEGKGKTNAQKKFMVVGLAMHVIGDTYAHVTLVPANFVNYEKKTSDKFNKSDFNDWKGFIEAVHTGNLTTSGIHQYTKEGGNAKYTDNPDFYPARWNMSRASCVEFVKQLLISGNTFDSSYMLRKNGLKLKNFDVYSSRI